MCHRDLKISIESGFSPTFFRYNDLVLDKTEITVFKFHYLSKIHDICNLIFLESLKQTLDFKQSTLDINYENF